MPAPGILSLRTLLSSMTTTLHPETFVFLHFPLTGFSSSSSAAPFVPPASLPIQMLFREAEGYTLITTLAAAEAVSTVNAGAATASHSSSSPSPSPSSSNDASRQPPSLSQQLLPQAADPDSGSGSGPVLLNVPGHGGAVQVSFPCRMLTLDVQSSLDAVGFMAEVTRALAAKGLGVNPVAGYLHDHLFVAAGRQEEAVEALEQVRREAAAAAAAAAGP